jgi:protein TonB
VFENLIESRRKRDLKSTLSNSMASIVFHAIAISAAVYATLSAGEAVQERVRQVDIVQQVQEQEPEPEPDRPPPVATIEPPPRGFQTLSIPTNIPVDIPPPATDTRFDAADFSGVGVEGGIARGVEGGTGPVVTDQPYMEAVVEERPERLDGTCSNLRYPPVLQTAGIEGRVLIEFIIDTTGRAERGSMRVVSSAHQLFEGPAREVVSSCRYRPGRISGRAVRTRVQIPINFTIQR